MILLMCLVQTVCDVYLQSFYFLFIQVFASSFRQMNLPQIQRILQEFEKQSEIMDMKEEVMNDAMDDAMGDEDDEEET